MISGDGVMMGYAFPVRVEAVYKAPDVPYVGLLKALDAVGRDQVYVTPSNRNNGGDHPAAFWGELLSTACKHKGVAGALTDGPVRDTTRMQALGFKVFGVQTSPLDIHHLSAGFELYLYQLFLRLGYSVQVSPVRTYGTDLRL